MMSELQIKKLVKQLSKDLDIVQNRFVEYDNHHDMTEYDRLTIVIETLKNVLEV
jgi:hypothetical protein